MPTISLWFSGQSKIELVKVRFSHPHLSEDRKSVRGKGFNDPYSFQWTAAVQAFAVLCLKGALARYADEEPFIDGEKGSLAASLDFAISKNTQWLQAMFGTDKEGNSLVKRLVVRTNSNMKRSGSVRVSLVPSLLRENSLCFIHNQKTIKTQSELQSLLRQIVEKDSLADINEALFLEELFNIYNQESLVGLTQSHIFDKQSSSELLSSIYENPSFQRIAGKAKLENETEKKLSFANRFGIFEGDVDTTKLFNESIRVALPVTLPAALTIFHHLHNRKKLPLEIEDRYCHALEIKKSIKRNDFIEPPDLCVLGIAPAASLLSDGKRCEYKPIMFMPALSHKILSNNPKGLGSTAGEYYFLNDEPSTATFYFNDMLRERKLSGKKTKACHAEPGEVFQALKSGSKEVQTIGFFPYYDLMGRHTKASFIDIPDAPLSSRMAVLFGHESFVQDPKKVWALNVMIRDAWLSLRRHHDVRRSVIKRFVSHTPFFEAVSRYSGHVL